MNSWILLKYLYLISVVTMMFYIVQNKDNFLVSFGIQNNNKEDEEQADFVFSMLMMVVLSPIVWVMILAQKNKR